jgi:hypothetical protein
MAEVVVFDIDAQSAIQKLAELRASTAELKKAQAELAKQVKAGNETSSEAAKTYEANAIILKNVANEQRVLSRQVEGYSAVQKSATDVTNFANNSIQQNRDLLKQLTAQYIGLKNPPKEATEQIKRLSDQLKVQESAIGDTRRNVGNYSDALQGLASRIPGVSKATDILNKVQNASPVGRLVTIFFALFDALKSNAQVMDTITFATEAINKAFSILADKAVEIGKRIVDAFTNPKKILEDIAFVLTNPIEAFRKLSNAALEFGKDIAQAGQEGFEAAKQLDQLVIAAAKTSAAIKESEIQVQALTKSLKDKTKSEKERIAIANQIADLEINNSKLSKQLAQDILAAEELKLKGKQRTAEEEAKIIQLQSAVNQAAAEEQIAVAQRTTRINILLEKELTNALKDEKGKQTEIVKDYFKQATDFQKKYIEEFLTGVEKELELLDLQQEQRRDFLIQAGLTDLEITEKFRQERLVIIDKYAEEEVKKEKEKADQLLEIKEQEAEAEYQIQQAKIQVAGAAAGILSDVAGQQTVLGKLLLAAQKAAAIAQIVIDTQREIIRINALYAGVPGAAVPFVVAAKIRAGIAIGTIAAQTIKSFVPPKSDIDTNLPRFADGGGIDISGNSHSQGGEVVTVGGKAVAEVEGGEGLYVMKKNAYQAIKQFSAINEAFGGKSWMKGSSKFLADGGAINTTLPILESRGRVNSTIEQNRILSEALKQLPAPVLSIKEFEKKQAVKDKSVRISEL